MQEQTTVASCFEEMVFFAFRGFKTTLTTPDGGDVCLGKDGHNSRFRVVVFPEKTTTTLSWPLKLFCVQFSFCVQLHVWIILNWDHFALQFTVSVPHCTSPHNLIGAVIMCVKSCQ